MAYQYIKVLFTPKKGEPYEAYQEILDGYVQRYVAEDGSVLFEVPPADKCTLVDASPTPPGAVATAGADRHADQSAVMLAATDTSPDAVDAALAKITGFSTVTERVLAAEVLRLRDIGGIK